MGGLGNQLFIYTAGLYLKELKGHDVSFFAPHLKDPKAHGYIHADSSILDLSFDAGFYTDVKRGEMSKQIRDLISAYEVRALPMHGGLSRRFPNYTSTQLGYDPDFDSVKRGTFVRGYFQSFRYLEALQSKGHFMNLELREPSRSFQEWEQRALSEKPLVIHVRRGDYSKTPNLGMLGRDYYQHAISAAKARSGKTNPEFWIFSDDPEFAQALAMELEIEALVISKGMNLRPAEEMVLMTLGSGHVIANSSFSWWSASMSSTSKFVIYPEKWFRGMDDPKDLAPPTWISSPSNWEST
jgi:hypothetical protein